MRPSGPGGEGAMYVIIVYDVEQKRVQKVCNFLRRYLCWVQNLSLIHI